MTFPRLQPCPADGDMPDELQSLFMPPPAETWKAIVERERRLTEERAQRLRELRLNKAVARLG